MKPIKDKEYLCIENLPGFNKEKFYICTGSNTFKEFPNFGEELSDEEYEEQFPIELKKMPEIELNLNDMEFEDCFINTDDVKYTLSPKGCFYAVMNHDFTDEDIERIWNIFDYRIQKFFNKSKFSRLIDNIFGINPKEIFSTTIRGIRPDMNIHQISFLYDDFVKTMKQHENI